MTLYRESSLSLLANFSVGMLQAIGNGMIKKKKQKKLLRILYPVNLCFRVGETENFHKQTKAEGAYMKVVKGNCLF